MIRTTSRCALLAGSFIAATTTAAFADEAADTAAARVLGGDGVTLADAGDCQQAIEKLKRAEELHHAPTTADRLGECEIATGRLVAGTERLQRLFREPLGPNPPAPFVEALARARRALDKALPRIGSLRISVRAPATAKVRVTVDGERMPDALLDNDRPTDPGRHTVVASAVGFLSSTEEVTLGEAETTKVALSLSPDPNARAAIVRPEPEAERGRAAAHLTVSSGGMGPAPVVAFSVGGIALGLGIISGLIVANDSSDLSKSCTANRVCPTDKQSEIGSAKTWATVSTVGFSVAGAGVGTGLLLFLLGNHEGRSSTEAKVRPVVGPLYLGCEGVL